jgi:hypothetical protein
LKRNYVKRQEQGSGATGPAHWGKWVTTLGLCGKGKRDEERKAGWLREIEIKRAKEI